MNLVNPPCDLSACNVLWFLVVHMPGTCIAHENHMPCGNELII